MYNICTYTYTQRNETYMCVFMYVYITKFFFKKLLRTNCKSRDGEPLKVVLEMMSLKRRKEDEELKEKMAGFQII